MKDVKNGMVVKNMLDLILKEIFGLCETKNLTKEQIKKYEITEREIFKKYDHLNEDELNAKSNKDVYAINVVMNTVITQCRGEKKEVKEK